MSAISENSGEYNNYDGSSRVVKVQSRKFLFQDDYKKLHPSLVEKDKVQFAKVELYQKENSRNKKDWLHIANLYQIDESKNFKYFILDEDAIDGEIKILHNLITWNEQSINTVSSYEPEDCSDQSSKRININYLKMQNNSIFSAISNIKKKYNLYLVDRIEYSENQIDELYKKTHQKIEESSESKEENEKPVQKIKEDQDLITQHINEIDMLTSDLRHNDQEKNLKKIEEIRCYNTQILEFIEKKYKKVPSLNQNIAYYGIDDFRSNRRQCIEELCTKENPKVIEQKQSGEYKNIQKKDQDENILENGRHGQYKKINQQNNNQQSFEKRMKNDIELLKNEKKNKVKELLDKYEVDFESKDENKFSKMTQKDCKECKQELKKIEEDYNRKKEDIRKLEKEKRGEILEVNKKFQKDDKKKSSINISDYKSRESMKESKEFIKEMDKKLRQINKDAEFYKNYKNNFLNNKKL